MTLRVSHINYQKRDTCPLQLYPTTCKIHSSSIPALLGLGRASKPQLPVLEHIPDTQSSENHPFNWHTKTIIFSLTLRTPHAHSLFRQLSRFQCFMNLCHKTQSYTWHPPDNKSTKLLVNIQFCNIDMLMTNLNLKLGFKLMFNTNFDWILYLIRNPYTTLTGAITPKLHHFCCLASQIDQGTLKVSKQSFFPTHSQALQPVP